MNETEDESDVRRRSKKRATCKVQELVRRECVDVRTVGRATNVRSPCRVVSADTMQNVRQSFDEEEQEEVEELSPPLAMAVLEEVQVDVHE